MSAIPHSFRLAFILVALLVTAERGRGANNVWTNATGNYVWSNTANNWQLQPYYWDNFYVDTAIFAPPQNIYSPISVDSAITVRAIRFDSGSYAFFGSGVLTLTSGNSGSLADGTIEVRTAGDASTAFISTSIAGNVGLKKTGAGNLGLYGTNTYSGDTSVSAGQLWFNSNASFGAAFGELILNGGALVYRGTGDTTLSRNIHLRNTSGSTIDVDDHNLTLSSPIDGYGGLTKTGAGNLLLNGTNAYIGGTFLNAGKLSFSSDANLGAASSNLTLNGGALIYNGTGIMTTARNVTFNSSGTIEVANPAAKLTVGGALTGAGGLIKTGPGTLELANGYGNNYSGDTTIDGGTLLIASFGRVLPSGGNVTVNSGATLRYAGGNYEAGNFDGPIGKLTLNQGTFAASGSFDFYLKNLEIGSSGGTIDLSNSTNTGIHFTGAGASIVVNYAFGGPTTIWTGGGESYIRNHSGSSLPISDGTVTASVRFISGPNGEGFMLTGYSTLYLKNPTGAGNTAPFQVVRGELRVDDMAALGTGTITLGGPNFGGLRYSGNSATSSKSLVLDSNAKIWISATGSNLTLNGIISEASPGSGVNIEGDRSFLTLTGANTYTGITHIRNGATLVVASIPNGGISSPLGTSANNPVNLQLTAGTSNEGLSTLRYTGPNATTDRGVYFNFGLGGIDVANAATKLTFTGEFAGTGVFVKTGAGTLELKNTTNSHGGTTVNSGTLLIATSGAVLPKDKDVTINTGGILQYFASNPDSPIGKLTLNGGTFVGNAAHDFYLNSLAVGSAGGTIDLSSSTNMWLHLVGTNATIEVSGNTTWIGAGSSHIQNNSGAMVPFTIATGSTVTSSLRFSRYTNADPGYKLLGGGTLFLSNPTGAGNTSEFRVENGSLRVNDIAHLGTGTITLAGALLSGSQGTSARLWYGGATTTTTKAFTLGNEGGTFYVGNAATTLTLAGVISGSGNIHKTGPGTLIISGTMNTYIGGTAIDAGSLQVTADQQLGSANSEVVVQPLGTLNVAASMATSRPFALNGGKIAVAGGQTLTFNNASVAGGFLTGNFATQAGSSTTFAGTTTLSSAAFALNGASAFNNANHGGQLAAATGSTTTLNGFYNLPAGRITVSSGAAVIAQEFQSSGRITVNSGGTFTQTSPTSAAPLTLGGGSVTTIDIGGTLSFGGSGVTQLGRLTGGLLVNNGTVNGGRLVVDYGGLARGTGSYSINPLTVNGGQYSPGSSPGRGNTELFIADPGSSYTFEINDGTPGLQGPSGTTNLRGWDLTTIRDNATPANSAFYVDSTSINPFTINLRTLTAPSPPDVNGPMDNFRSDTAAQWLAFSVDPAATDPFPNGFDPASFAINTSGFANGFDGKFSIARAGNDLLIVYTPVPEPGTILGFSAAWLAVTGWLRRRNK